MIVDSVIGKRLIYLGHLGYVNLAFQLQILWNPNADQVLIMKTLELRYALSIKYTPDIRDLVENNVKIFTNNVWDTLHVEIILEIHWVKWNIKLISRFFSMWLIENVKLHICMALHCCWTVLL